MTVIETELGARIDCDNCGQSMTSPDLTIEQLRAATGYVCPSGQDFDFCPDCAHVLFGASPP